MTTEEVNQPVVSFIWNVQLGQLLQQSGVTHRVKRLTEIEGYDYDIWICKETVDNVVE